MWVCDMCAAKMVVAKKIEPFSQAYGIGRDAFGNVNYYSGKSDAGDSSAIHATKSASDRSAGIERGVPTNGQCVPSEVAGRELSVLSSLRRVGHGRRFVHVQSGV